jgi:hypothetical protein
LTGRGRPSGVIFVRHALPAFVLEFCEWVAHAKIKN